jgi:Secretion system C-terminal sorting domain
MKKIITIVLLLIVMANVSPAQVKVGFSLGNRSISAGILSYDLIATVPAGQTWSVGAATIRLNISPNPASGLTIHPDNPVINPNPNINSGIYQPLKTLAASATIMSFNILTFNTSGFYRFNPGTYTLGKVRFNVVGSFVTDSIKFRVNPPFTTALTTVNDSTVALVYPTTFTITNPTLVGTGNNTSELPKEFKLYENYPNPFNPTTSIKYDIANNSFVKLTVYDVTGKEVETLVNDNLQAGRYEASFNGSTYSSGIYFAKIEAGSYKHIIKMVMIK